MVGAFFCLWNSGDLETPGADWFSRALSIIFGMNRFLFKALLDISLSFRLLYIYAENKPKTGPVGGRERYGGRGQQGGLAKENEAVVRKVIAAVQDRQRRTALAVWYNKPGAKSFGAL